MSAIRMFNRRQFIKKLGVTTIAGISVSLLPSCTHKKFLNPDEDIILAGGSYREYEQLFKALVVINLTQREKRVIDCDFVPYGIFINPQNKYSVYCFEKNGSNACEINIQKLAITRKFNLDSPNLFSGGAAFNQDGKFIYTVEYNSDTKQGVVVKRNTISFEQVKSFPSLGLAPRQCLITDRNTILLNNTGRSESNFHQPSIVEIDPETEKLVRRIKLDDSSLNADYFTLKGSTLIIASGALTPEVTQSGLGISENYRFAENINVNSSVTQSLTGKVSPVTFDQDKGIAATAYPQANKIAFWNTNTRELMKVLDIEQPRCISLSLDQKHFIISYGVRPTMIKLSISNFSPAPDSFVQPTFASGETMVNWSLRLRKIMPADIYN